MRDEHIAEIYTALEGLVVELDPDPNARGPGYLQDLISKTRGFLNRTSHYLHEVLREVHAEEMALEALESAFQVASDELMSNDRRVSGLPSIQDRLAMVNVLLGAERREITTRKRVLKNLGHVERVIRHRHKELENTMSAIRLQRSLLETEIRTGSFYGDESEQSRGSRWAKASATQVDVSEDEIAQLLKVAEGTLQEPDELGSDDIAKMMAAVEEDGPTPSVPETASAKPVEAGDKDIQRFLTQEEDDEELFKNL